MKRITLLCVTFSLLMTTLTSCIIIPRHKNFDIDEAVVESVEIYDLSRNAEILETEDDYKYIKNFNPSETTSVYTLPAESNADFLEDLTNIQFTDYIIIILAAIDPSFNYNRWTARINYTDGSYEFLSCDGYGETFDQNGEGISCHHYGCEEIEWQALIEKYVPEDIFSYSIEVE